MSTIIEKSNSIINKILVPQLQLDIGIWMNGQTYWMHNQTEKILTKEKVTVRVSNDYPHSRIRNSFVYVTNHDRNPKTLKLVVMHRYLEASKDHLAFISPSEQIIFHLANKKVFLVNGYCEGQAIQQATVQPFWSMNTDYMWTDIQKGTLKYLPLAKGIAVSVFMLEMDIPGHETKKAITWTIQGEAKKDLININQTLLKKHTSISF
jgi:hypothetical protein